MSMELSEGDDAEMCQQLQRISKVKGRLESIEEKEKELLKEKSNVFFLSFLCVFLDPFFFNLWQSANLLNMVEFAWMRPILKSKGGRTSKATVQSNKMENLTNVPWDFFQYFQLGWEIRDGHHEY